MINNETTIDVLNDLVKINNDRIEGYEKALKDLPAGDIDLRELFISMIDESHHYKQALVEEVQVAGGDADKGATTSEKIYHAFMGVKAVFSGHDRKAILGNCEAVEDAAQSAYITVLQPKSSLPSFLKDLVLLQQQSLKASHDKIKFLRDQNSL